MQVSKIAPPTNHEAQIDELKDVDNQPILTPEKPRLITQFLSELKSTAPSSHLTILVRSLGLSEAPLQKIILHKELNALFLFRQTKTDNNKDISPYEAISLDHLVFFSSDFVEINQSLIKRHERQEHIDLLNCPSDPQEYDDENPDADLNQDRKEEKLSPPSDEKDEFEEYLPKHKEPVNEAEKTKSNVELLPCFGFFTATKRMLFLVVDESYESANSQIPSSIPESQDHQNSQLVFNIDRSKAEAARKKFLDSLLETSQQAKQLTTLVTPRSPSIPNESNGPSIKQLKLSDDDAEPFVVSVPWLISLNFQLEQFFPNTKETSSTSLSSTVDDDTISLSAISARSVTSKQAKSQEPKATDSSPLTAFSSPSFDTETASADVSQAPIKKATTLAVPKASAQSAPEQQSLTSSTALSKQTTTAAAVLQPDSARPTSDAAKAEAATVTASETPIVAKGTTEAPATAGKSVVVPPEVKQEQPPPLPPCLRPKQSHPLFVSPSLTHEKAFTLFLRYLQSSWKFNTNLFYASSSTATNFQQALTELIKQQQEQQPLTTTQQQQSEFRFISSSTKQQFYVVVVESWLEGRFYNKPQKILLHHVVDCLSTPPPPPTTTTTETTATTTVEQQQQVQQQQQQLLDALVDDNNKGVEPSLWQVLCYLPTQIVEKQQQLQQQLQQQQQQNKKQIQQQLQLLQQQIPSFLQQQQLFDRKLKKKQQKTTTIKVPHSDVVVVCDICQQQGCVVCVVCQGNGQFACTVCCKNNKNNNKTTTTKTAKTTGNSLAAVAPGQEEVKQQQAQQQQQQQQQQQSPPGFVVCSSCHGKAFHVCSKCKGQTIITKQQPKQVSNLLQQQQELQQFQQIFLLENKNNNNDHNNKSNNKEVDKNNKNKQHPCVNCSGAGRFVCFDCQGQGKLLCNKCKGGGSFFCDKCQGLGRFTCSNCLGNKKFIIYKTIQSYTEYKTNHDLCVVPNEAEEQRRLQWQSDEAKHTSNNIDVNDKKNKSAQPAKSTSSSTSTPSFFPSLAFLDSLPLTQTILAAEVGREKQPHTFDLLTTSPDFLQQEAQQQQQQQQPSALNSQQQQSVEQQLLSLPLSVRASIRKQIQAFINKGEDPNTVKKSKTKDKTTKEETKDPSLSLSLPTEAHPEEKLQALAINVKQVNGWFFNYKLIPPLQPNPKKPPKSVDVDELPAYSFWVLGRMAPDPSSHSLAPSATQEDNFIVYENEYPLSSCCCLM